jgi:SAM-dependent methyltransferase
MMLNTAQQLYHAMLPKATHDEKARQEYARAFREYTINHVLPGNRMVYENKVVPQWKREKGRAPKDRMEIRDAMEKEPYFQDYANLYRVSQELLWESVTHTVERQLPDLIEKAKTNGKALGSLTLDPNFEVPRYITAVDIHCMPGNYHSEQAPDDVAVGAIYDRGVFLYAMGMLGPKIDDMGMSGANFVKRKFPNFKPKRILDMGCTVGHATLPYVDAFPDAEVYAIDVGAPCLRYAHGRAEALGKKVHFSQQNAEKTNFPDGYFDLIVSHILLHETSGKAMPAIFKESFRLLAPGGIVAHVDLPPFDQMDEFNQFMTDNETYYNNEPFWGAMRAMDQPKLAIDAGFTPDKVGFDLAPMNLLEQLGIVKDDSFVGGEFAPGTAWEVLVARK